MGSTKKRKRVSGDLADATLSKTMRREPRSSAKECLDMGFQLSDEGPSTQWGEGDLGSPEEEGITEFYDSETDNKTDEDDDYNSDDEEEEYDFIDDDDDANDGDDSTGINGFNVEMKVNPTYSPRSRASSEWDPEYWGYLCAWGKDIEWEFKYLSLVRECF